MSQLTDSKKTSEKINEPLNNEDNIRVEQEILSLQQADIDNNEDNILVEQEILNLKETSEFISSKIKVMKVSDVPVRQKNFENVDIENTKTQSLTDSFNLQCTDKAIQNILFGNFTLQSINLNSSEDSASELYKQKVIEQLELLKNNYEHVMQLYERQDEVLSEIFKISMSIEKQDLFQNKLKGKTIQYQRVCKEKESDLYKQQMEKIKTRIEKINFMRVIMHRLLTYVQHNWKEKSELTTELKELFKFTNSPVSVNSLLKE